MAQSMKTAASAHLRVRCSDLKLDIVAVFQWWRGQEIKSLAQDPGIGAVSVGLLHCSLAMDSHAVRGTVRHQKRYGPRNEDIPVTLKAVLFVCYFN